MTPLMRMTFSGSSPRLRGTLNGAIEGGKDMRFIPALAGNTIRHPLAPPSVPVHPRACGEHVIAHYLPDIHSGSSPRLRGTHNLSCTGVDLARFIPALAGNTAAYCWARALTPVHPRACGEHCQYLSSRRKSLGSSPRLRGTPNARHVERMIPRFIPALAGNTVKCLF